MLARWAVRTRLLTSRRASPVVAVVAAMFAALLILPGVAAAAPDTMIGFDDLPVGTVVSDQYASSDGTSFGDPASFGLPRDPSTPCYSGGPTVQSALDDQALDMSCVTGSVEFHDWFADLGIGFTTEHRAASFELGATTAVAYPATVTFYGIGAAVLSTQTVSVGPGAPVTVSYNHGTADGGVVGITISGAFGSNYGDNANANGAGVYLDDLDVTNEDTPPPAKFAVAALEPSTDIVEGSTAGVPVAVLRYNGSTGPVSLHVPSLPAGVTATSFSSGTVSGSAPVTLNATAASPFTGTADVTVQTGSAASSAGEGIVTSATVNLTGLSALTWGDSTRLAVHAVPGCGPQRIDDGYSVRGGYSGEIDKTASAWTGLNTAPQIEDPFVAGGGDGGYPFSYLIDPSAGADGGQFELTLSGPDITTQNLTQTWIADPVSVSGQSTTSTSLPLVNGGSQVTILGDFSTTSCPVRFQDQEGHVWSIASHDTATVNNQILDRFVLNVPSDAVSGPLNVMVNNPLGNTNDVLTQTPSITVSEFRQSYGFRQVNGGDGARTDHFDWDDFQRVFGDDDTEDCFIGCWHDPGAQAWYDQIRDDVEANPGKGLCYGYAVLAARLRNPATGQKPSDYQAGTTRVWDITDFSDLSPVKRDIVRWFAAQWDQGARDSEKDGQSLAPGDKIAAIETQITDTGSALITLHTQIPDGKGGWTPEGHAVLAYGVYDDGAGGHILQLYNPNFPYDASEASDGTFRDTQLQRNQIDVHPDGSWETANPADGTLPPNGWSGDNSTISVVRNLPASNATLPSHSLLWSIFGSAVQSGTAVSSITSGGKQLLGSHGDPKAGSGLTPDPAATGGAPDPTYAMTAGRAYTFTVTGAASGSYSQMSSSPGDVAQVLDAHTQGGQNDRITVTPGKASIGFASGGHGAPVTLDLVARSGKASETATIDTTAATGSADQASLSGGQVVINHQGPAVKDSLTLGWVGSGLSGSVQTAPITVGKGQSVTVAPSSWQDLSDGVGYVLRNSHGKVVKHGSVKLRASKQVGVSGVHATRKKGVLTVTGKITKPGSSPILLARVTLLRHGKVVALKSTDLTGAKVKRGQFRLALRLGSLPSGTTQIRVDVELVDEVAGMPTAHKRFSLNV